MQIVHLSRIPVADLVSVSGSFLGLSLHLMKSGCVHYEPIFPLSFITEIVKTNHLESSILPALKARGENGEIFFKENTYLKHVCALETMISY